MLIKAGTYTFNEIPTELESGQSFEQNINLTFTETDEDITGTFYVSKISGVKVDYFAIYYTLYSLIVEGEEQLSEEMLYPIYSTNGDGWGFSRTHTITEDTEVDDTFGTWYKANTQALNAETIKIENVIIYDNGIRLSYNELFEGINYIVVDTTPTDNILITDINTNVVNMYYICDINRIGTFDGAMWNVYNATLIEDEAEAVDNEQTVAYVVVKYIDEGEETPTKKFTRLYLGEVVYSSNGKRFRKLQTEEYVEPSLRFEPNGDGTCYVTGLGSYTSPNIVIPSASPDGDSVTGIHDYSLMSRQSIKSVTIPNTVTFIGREAFYSCEALESVVIGNGVTVIYDMAFFGCSKLNNITFNGTVEQWNAISLGINWKYYVPAEFVQCTNGRVWLGEKISDLRNTTWHLASGWTAPKGYGVFSVRVQVTRSNSEVILSNGIAVGFEYQNDINNIPSVENVIYLPTGSVNIYSNEAIDVYFVDSTYDTDITNTDLIDWLYTYGELKTETL